jgi:predicted nucleic acid-binding protein
VSAFLIGLVQRSEFFTDVPRVFELTRDPKDEPYLNLAIAAGASFLVARDKDLLDLATEARPDAQAFRSTYPTLRIVDPVVFLDALGR